MFVGYDLPKETDNPSLVSLSETMKQIQASITNLSLTMANSLKSTTDSNNESLMDLKPSNRQYVSLWKDLGGPELCFYAGGSYHPVQFLKKLTKLLDEAGVPDSARVGLAVSSLEGPAADWAGYREDSFRNYSDFVEAFQRRYWGPKEQKELYNEIKNGKFDGKDNRADYFLHLACMSTYLTEKITEKELVQMLADHFRDDSDIRRGIIAGGLDSLEEVEDFLRRIDSTSGRGDAGREENNNPIFNRRPRYPYWKRRENDRGSDRRERD